MRLMLLIITFATAISAQAKEDRDVLYQVSTIDALLAGLYDGVAKVGDVTDHGDFGLGTFDQLDGEMIVFKGQVYQATVDGSVNLMPSDARTPFMAVTHFNADRQLNPPANLDYAEFKTWLNGEFPSQNIIYAVEVDAKFSSITFRSVPRQEHKPYQALAEVTRHQTLFNQEQITGTLIGFWCPAFTKGLNVPGFHLHFLSSDRKHAGHVLDFTLAEGVVRIDFTNGWDVQLPLDPAFLKANLNEDRSAALHSVEQGGKAK